MSEWNELKIDNLPPDILSGGYSVRIDYGGIWSSEVSAKDTILAYLKGEFDHPMEYRKPEPEAPSHEEIMTKWWRVRNVWYRVERTTFSNDLRCQRYVIDSSWVYATYFIDKESADIPPE